MTRSDGIELVKKYDHVKPMKSLNYFLKTTNMSEEKFDETADTFRNNRVWWIENNKWYKDNIWGEPQSYGDVKLSKDDQKKYKNKNLK